jgi:hypothetical protein
LENFDFGKNVKIRRNLKMGVIRDIVDQVDKSEEEKEKLGETLDLLVSLSEAKAEHCVNTIEEDLRMGRVAGNTTLRFPISLVADKRVQYRCTTTDTPGDLIDTISDSIVGMFDDHTPKGIINGIAKTANEFLQVLLGAGEGTEQYAQVYTTGIEGSGVAMNLIRIDFMFWCRKITASSLKEKMDSALACVAYKSIIDVSKLRFDDFRNIYSKVVDKGLPEDLSDKERKDKIIQAIKDAKEIFELLGGTTDGNSNKLLSANSNAVSISDIVNPGLELGIVFE